MLKTGIICAVDGELEPFLPHIGSRFTTEASLLKIYEGDIFGLKIAALYSGVCKVNAAIAAQILIDRFGAGIIINAGVAGGIKNDVDVLDTIVSTEVAYHDVNGKILTEYHPWMPSEFFASDSRLVKLAESAARDMPKSHKILFGKTVTGEKFITNECRGEIIDAFNPLAVDMESAAVAHVCYANRVPFIAVRTITDNALHDGQDHFETNFETASRLSCAFTLALLGKIHENEGLF